MLDLAPEAVDLLFEADQYSIDGLAIDDEETDNAARSLVSQGLAEWGTGPCETDLCDCEVPVIRLTPAGVAELSRIAESD